MRTLLRYAVAVGVLCLGSLHLELRAQPVGPTPLRAREAYAIYNVLLQDFAEHEKTKLLSIVRFTTSPDTTCSFEREFNTEQWQSALADLRHQNRVIHRLEPNFHLPFRHELSDSMQRVGGARLPPPGKDQLEFLREQMEILEKMDREGYSQVQLSAPGISTDGNVAIVYLAISFAGETRVLRKKNDRWIIDPRPLCAWIS